MSAIFNPIHADDGPVDGKLFNRVQDLIARAIALAVRDSVAVTTSPGGAASSSAYYVVTRSTNAPANSTNLGALTSGVLQQVVTAGSSAVTATAFAAGAIPFGISSGLLTQNPLVFLDNSTASRPKMVVGSVAVPATGVAVASFHAYKEDGGAVFDGGFVGATYSTVSNFSTLTLRRSRGTIASPAAVDNGSPSGQADILGQLAVSGMNTGLTFTRPLGFFSWVQFGATVDSTHVPASLAVCNDQSVNTTGGATMSINGITQAWTTSGDIVIGWYAKNPADTLGYVYTQRTTSGPPTGTPIFPTRFAGAATDACPFIVDDLNRRFYSYSVAAPGWHFAQMMDFDPTATRVPFGGAGAHTLIDDAGLTFDPTAGLIVGTSVTLSQTAATGAVALTLANGPTAATPGDPQTYLKIKVGATTYAVPAWQI